MKKFSLTLLSIIFTVWAIGQELTQTVRGTIIDVDSKMPLPGATIVIPGSDPLIGTITDPDGKFRLENVPLGRITLKLSFIGFESQTHPNVEVNSGKEVVLNLEMQESAVKLNEVVIKASREKGAAINDMSLVSARSISVEETKRYAGGFSDPSRILSSFAGVANSHNGENDIIVRGNSPKYVQWRVEGMDITNPTHFADQNSIKGGISALNNNLLAASDFYTGAFSAEYGNVLSGVYDVKLRAGNNEKFEAAFGLGILGTEFTLEGPFKKGYGGSYLFNYRYSTVGLVEDIGLVDAGGSTKFQDATFKVILPSKKAGTFSLFGLAGQSSFSMEDVDPEMRETPGNKTIADDISEDYDKNNYLLNIGMNHTMPINRNSYLKTLISYSTEGIKDEVYELKSIKDYDEDGNLLTDTVLSQMLNFKNKLRKSTLRGALTYHHKISAKNKIQIGTNYSLFNYNNQQGQLQGSENSMSMLMDFNEKVGTLRNFVNWRYRINENLTLVSGLHNMNVLMNGKSTLEPRIAIDWKLDNSSSIHAGYGNHSSMESIHHYFAIVKQEDGTVTEPNKDLGLLKANHWVFGYEKRFTKNLMASVELYYQGLYNLPVENLDTSYFATINEGMDFRYVDLVNEGTGKNYGIEITVEKFFDKHYYFLVNGSLFNSKYKSLEGVERNTAYNGNYMVNILAGKEFIDLGKKKNQTLTLNTKIFFGGGQKIIPLLRDDNGNLAVDPDNNRYWDYGKAYDDKIEDIYQINLSASYKFNRARTTHELFVDLINVTNNRAKMYEYYDESENNSVGHVTQFGFFPNIMYRVYL